MRKVYLEELPRRGRLIDWKNSVGYKIQFQYDNIMGNFEVIGYDKSSQLLTLLYENQQYNIKTMHLNECKIQMILNLRTFEYKYNIGDIITEVKNGKLKILEQIKIKSGKSNVRGYVYQCLICNHSGEKIEYDLDKYKGCPVCSGLIVKVGINDIWSTNYNLGQLLNCKEDGYKYTQCSDNKVDWKCPDCGEIIKNISISKVFKQRLSCPRCSDRSSYPNKIGFNLLKQLNLTFESEYSPDWIKPKRYDFYFELNGKKYILEMDGGFHTKNNLMNGQTVQESIELDNYKDKMALKHGVDVIRIECEKSELEYIKCNLISKLSDLFELSHINWIACHEYACTNLIKKTCELWNSGIQNTKEISEIIGNDRSTVTEHLKKGTLLNWCNYSPEVEIIKNNISKSQIIVQIDKNTNKTIAQYNSIREAERISNKSRLSIARCCKGEYKTAGGFKWMYLTDYEQYLQSQKVTESNIS